MAEVVLFHHAQGLTPGVAAFADELRRAGHTVHAPDLYDGRTFATLEEGLAYAEEIGFDEVTERGVQAAEALPAELVYAGFSLGLGPAQRLAQTRPGARARYYSTLACRYRSSVRRGRRGFPCRSTRWSPTQSSTTGGTSLPLGL
jgi:dienelactone hydrolase